MDARVKPAHDESITRFAIMDSGLAGFRPRPGMTKLYAAYTALPFVPAQAGTQEDKKLDSRFRGNDLLLVC
jgi:hypothetical protein